MDSCLIIEGGAVCDLQAAFALKMMKKKCELTHSKKYIDVLQT